MAASFTLYISHLRGSLHLLCMFLSLINFKRSAHPFAIQYSSVLNVCSKFRSSTCLTFYWGPFCVYNKYASPQVHSIGVHRQSEQPNVGQTHVIMNTMNKLTKHELFIEGTTYIHNTKHMTSTVPTAAYNTMVSCIRHSASCDPCNVPRVNWHTVFLTKLRPLPKQLL